MARCISMTMSGRRCRSAAVSGGKYCRVHKKKHSPMATVSKRQAQKKKVAHTKKTASKKKKNVASRKRAGYYTPSSMATYQTPTYVAQSQAPPQPQKPSGGKPPQQQQAPPQQQGPFGAPPQQQQAPPQHQGLFGAAPPPGFQKQQQPSPFAQPLGPLPVNWPAQPSEERPLTGKRKRQQFTTGTSPEDRSKYIKMRPGELRIPETSFKKYLYPEEVELMMQLMQENRKTPRINLGIYLPVIRLRDSDHVVIELNSMKTTGHLTAIALDGISYVAIKFVAGAGRAMDLEYYNPSTRSNPEIGELLKNALDKYNVKYGENTGYEGIVTEYVLGWEKPETASASGFYAMFAAQSINARTDLKVSSIATNNAPRDEDIVKAYSILADTIHGGRTE